MLIGGDRGKVIMDDRKLEVLRAIVEDYVATREPVGSKALAERHNFGVSSATLRNDMAMLEEEGYIVAPHTSAGRVPTDKGYRLFVDRIAQIKPLSPAERRAIHQFLDAAVDLDDVMQRTVRLLAQLTHQVALVQYPTLTRSGVRHVEIVGLTPRRVLLVVIADTVATVLLLPWRFVRPALVQRRPQRCWWCRMVKSVTHTQSRTVSNRGATCTAW